MTTLFAAVDVKSGMIIGECLPRHRELLRFLRRIDRAVLNPRDVHLVLDSEADQKTAQGTVFPPDATHKTPRVKAWLEKHLRFKLHFTPTSASWLNLVERSLAEITSKRMRRGSFTSVDDLKTTIYGHLGPHKTRPKPFT